MACGLARGGLQVGLQLGVCLPAGREADARIGVAGGRHVGYQAQGDKDAHSFFSPRGVKAAGGAKKRRIDRVPDGVPVVIDITKITSFPRHYTTAGKEEQERRHTMSDEMKKQLEEAIEQIRQLPPEKQNMCTGFVLGINAAAALKPAQPVEQPGERGA